MTTHDAANLAGTVAMKADPVAVVAVKAVPTAEAAGGGVEAIAPIVLATANVTVWMPMESPCSRLQKKVLQC